jgi:hypothetical protein
MVGRLDDFPCVIVRVDCPVCPHRKGQYRLTERPPSQYDPKCKARFINLEVTRSPPPDFAPVMRKLTNIPGGER